MKRKKKSKSTKDWNPYQLVKRFAFNPSCFSFISCLCSQTKPSRIIYRAGEFSTFAKIVPSDGCNGDEPVLVGSNVGNVPRIDKKEVECAMTSQTEENFFSLVLKDPRPS